MNYVYKRRSMFLPVIFFSLALAVLMVMGAERLPADKNSTNNMVSGNQIIISENSTSEQSRR